ncbi:MAG: DUF3187 family protein [Deltaproteobacteria bacterium]|nr:DUF3187 family protein [Deltaproteobacteria bacterium]
MRKILFFLFFITLSFPQPVRAGIFHLSDYHTYGPLPVRTQNPLYLLFVGESLDRASILQKGDFSTSIETTFANLFERRPRAAGIGIDLDMELLRTAVNFSYGLTDHLELGFQLPFLSFSGGFLDSFIQGYHDTFGFPNGGRSNVDNGRFSYRVTQNGAALYQVDQATFRLSDMVLIQKLRLFDESKGFPAVSLKNSIKLPTGSRIQGTGSGRPDLAVSLLAEKSVKRLHSYTQMGFLALGGHADLNPILKNGSFTFGQAFEFNVFEHLSFIGQVSGQSSLFSRTELPELSKIVLDLTFGFTGEAMLNRRINPSTKLRVNKIKYLFGFTEDATSEGPSVDFSLFFNVGMEY